MVQRKMSTGFAKTMSKVLKYVLIFIIIYYCSVTAFTFGRALFTDRGAAADPGIDMTIQVDESESIRKLAKTLEEYGIIKDKNVLYVQSLIYGVKTIKAGTYTFNTSESGEEILKVINAGPQEDLEEETTSAEE